MSTTNWHRSNGIRKLKIGRSRPTGCGPCKLLKVGYDANPLESGELERYAVHQVAMATLTQPRSEQPVHTDHQDRARQVPGCPATRSGCARRSPPRSSVSSTSRRSSWVGSSLFARLM
ncbi:hypothetical protein FDZ84_25725 [Saccharopolyspora sp. ASAGF58]|nr:hypothetical protein FDZ84_25725 [Saccharopolyspora sp. ASAGF58]